MSEKKFVGECMICKNTKEVRNIDLFVIGSEGLNLCFGCESLILDFIHNLMRLVGEFRIKNALRNRNV